MSFTQSRETLLYNRTLYLDRFGRVVLDECPDAHEHLVNPRRTDGQRSKCATVVDERLFPEFIGGKKGTFRISIVFEET